METDNKIILPLDNVTLKEAISIVEKTKDLVWGFKVNSLLLIEGVHAIEMIKSTGARVMADLKLYDIPNTMSTSITSLRLAGADIITVHASAAYNPVDHQKEHLAGVTILTSFDTKTFEQVYGEDEMLPMKVLEFAGYCRDKEYGYIVCSPRELVTLEPLTIKKICPGIRPAWYKQEDDQVRTMTPGEAIKAGATLLVMGRPILRASDMAEALKKTNDEINEA